MTVASDVCLNLTSYNHICYIATTPQGGGHKLTADDAFVRLELNIMQWQANTPEQTTPELGK